MWDLIGLVALFLMPCAFFWVMLKSYELFVHGLPDWMRRPPPTPKPDLERLTADLRRLSRLYERAEASREPVHRTKLIALSMAYDDVLCASCHAAGLPVPERPLQAITRLETEAALAGCGVSW